MPDAFSMLSNSARDKLESLEAWQKWAMLVVAVLVPICVVETGNTVPGDGSGWGSGLETDKECLETWRTLVVLCISMVLLALLFWKLSTLALGRLGVLREGDGAIQAEGSSRLARAVEIKVALNVISTSATHFQVLSIFRVHLQWPHVAWFDECWAWLSVFFFTNIKEALETFLH